MVLVSWGIPRVSGLVYSQTISPKVNPTGSYRSPGCRSVLFQNQVEETHQADALGGKCEQSLSATLRWAEGHLLNFTQTSRTTFFDYVLRLWCPQRQMAHPGSTGVSSRACKALLSQLLEPPSWPSLLHRFMRALPPAMWQEATNSISTFPSSIFEIV